MNSLHKTIKMIAKKNYEVALTRDQDDMYYIRSLVSNTNWIDYSSPISDYNMASFLFDSKVEVLEGI